MKIDRERIARWLLVATFVTAPLGTVWIFRFGEIAGRPWPLGNIGLYLSEVFALGYLAARVPVIRRAVTGRSPFWLLAFVLPLISVLHASDVLLATVAFARVIFALLVMLVIAEEREFVADIRAWISGMLIPTTAAFLQVFLFHGVPAVTLLGIAAHPLLELGTAVVETGGERMLRAYATFPHPNILGGYALLCLLVLVAARVRGRETRGASIALSIAAAASGALLALSVSRGAMLAVVAAVAISLWRRIISVRDCFAIGMPAVAGFGLIVLLSFPVFASRADFQNRLETRSTDERAVALRETEQVMREHSAFGIGPMHASKVFSDRFGAAHEWIPEPPHMVEALAILEYGVLGFLGLLALILFVVTAIREPSPLLFPAFLGWAALGLFDHYPLTSSQFLLLSGLALGIIARSYRMYAHD